MQHVKTNASENCSFKHSFDSKYHARCYVSLVVIASKTSAVRLMPQNSTIVRHKPSRWIISFHSQLSKTNACMYLILNEVSTVLPFMLQLHVY
jgi:hypothetical protein